MNARSLSRRSFLQNLSAGSLALTLGRARLAAQSAPPARKLGVALFGLGNYSTGELGPALRETRLCRLAGVVSGSAEKAKRWAREYGFPERNCYHYENFDRIADNPDIDILYIVTPPGLHCENVVRAAKTGKHIICEKPMAVTVAECDQMIAACRDAGVQLAIGYRMHYDPSHRELVRLQREKDFGELTGLSGGHGFRVRSRIWRLTQKLGGGGPLMDVGIYVVNAACLAAGAAPLAVTAREEPKTNPELFAEVEETLHWTMEFPGGASCAGVTSYARNLNAFRAEGAQGWIELQPAFSYRGVRVTTSRGPFDFVGPNQQALQMDDFADCILTGRRTPVPGELGRRDMQIIRAIYEAARTGKRVEL
ncbi:MAG TPA: Gfo/Idh/MocA family oxidoreductase [Opitutaceae bacterium]